MEGRGIYLTCTLVPAVSLNLIITRVEKGLLSHYLPFKDEERRLRRHRIVSGHINSSRAGIRPGSE